MSLSGRDWNTCLNHCLPPSKGQRRFRRQLLLLNHRPHRVRTPRLQFASSGLWDFTLTVQAVFGKSIQLLGAMVGVRRAEAYRNKVCHTGLWTLSRRHIQPKVWKCPLHIRGRSTRAIVPPNVVKMYVYSRYLLGSRWSSQNTFARFYKLDVHSLAFQVRSVSD